jgi:hypothetical protein
VPDCSSVIAYLQVDDDRRYVRKYSSEQGKVRYPRCSLAVAAVEPRSSPHADVQLEPEKGFDLLLCCWSRRSSSGWRDFHFALCFQRGYSLAGKHVLDLLVNEVGLTQHE